jgi:hypothetical protein
MYVCEGDPNVELGGGGRGGRSAGISSAYALLCVAIVSGDSTERKAKFF